jgi:hypothetical protein
VEIVAIVKPEQIARCGPRDSVVWLGNLAGAVMATLRCRSPISFDRCPQTTGLFRD